jgi:hypothetical protein
VAKTYTIFDFKVVTASVTAIKFFAALFKKGEDGKSLYYWYDDGEYSFAEHRYIHGDNNFLFPKASEHLKEIYRIHHNDIERQRMQGIRRIRRGVSVASLTIEDDDALVEREVADEHSESDIYAPAEYNDLAKRLGIVLNELQALEREVIAALYGLDGQVPMSKTACAAALGKNWRTIARAEERAIAKLRDLLADFSDYSN